MNGMRRVSHSLGGVSIPREGWDPLCGRKTPPVLLVGQEIRRCRYSIVAKEIVRWPEVPGLMPGGLEMRSCRDMIDE